MGPIGETLVLVGADFGLAFDVASGTFLRVCLGCLQQSYSWENSVEALVAEAVCVKKGRCCCCRRRASGWRGFELPGQTWKHFQRTAVDAQKP